MTVLFTVLAAALAVGIPALATAWAQSRIGPAIAASMAEKPELLLLNKADRLNPEQREAAAKRFGGVCVSALNGEGIPEMLAAVERLTFGGEKR